MKFAAAGIFVALGVLWYGYYDTQRTIADCRAEGGAYVNAGSASLCLDEQGRVIP